LKQFVHRYQQIFKNEVVRAGRDTEKLLKEMTK